MTTGTEINYYFVCHRKLWLFARNLQMEQESQDVHIGRLIHDQSYTREPRKEMQFEGIKLDFVDLRDGVIHEVKKSKSIEPAHRWQLLYYLYVLKKAGSDGLKGEIDYPLLRRREEVVLTDELETELLGFLEKVEDIKRQPSAPDRIRKSFCKTCSYFELCWV